MKNYNYAANKSFRWIWQTAAKPVNSTLCKKSLLFTLTNMDI